MLPRSFIALEAQSVDILRVKSVQKTRSNPSALTAALAAYKKQLHSEKHLPIDPNMLKSKRQIVLARQHEIEMAFQMDIDQIQFAFEDNNRSVLNFNQNKTFLSSQMVLYIQPTEKRLASQKNKLMQRITGFTREIIDSIHEDRSTDPANVLLNRIVYTLQDCLKRLLSDNYLPDLTTLEILFKNDSADTVCLLFNPIILLNALQYLDALASHNTTSLFKKPNDRTRYENTLNRFNTIIPYSFHYIRNAYTTLSPDYSVVSLIIYQTIKTLRAVLNVMISLHTDMLNNNDKNDTLITPPNNNNNANRVRVNSAFDNINPSSNKASLFWDTCWGSDYTLNHLSTDLILLLKIIKLARIYRVDSKCHEEVFCVHGSLHTKLSENNQSSVFGEINSQCLCALLVSLQPYAQIGAYLCTNIMFCVDNVIMLLICTSDLSSPWSTAIKNTNNNSDQTDPLLTPPTPPKHTPRIFNSLSHELLLSSLDLALICVNQYSIRLGHVGGVSSHILSDNIYVQSCDREATAAVNLATTAFAHNILDTQTLLIFRAAFELTVPRAGGFLLMSAFVKCVLAGCLLAVNWPLGVVEGIDDTQLRLFAEKQSVCLKRVSEERVMSDLRLRGINTPKPPANSVTQNTPSTPPAVKSRIAPQTPQIAKQTTQVEPSQTPSITRNTVNHTKTHNHHHSVKQRILTSDTTPIIDTDLVDSSQLSVVATSDVDVHSVLSCDEQPQNTPPIQPNTQLHYTFSKKSELISILSECTLRVMSIMFIHRTSLSICHIGMIIIRLLTRDLFIKKARIDEYFVTPLGHILKPQVDIYILKKKNEDGDEEYDDNDNNNNTANNSAISTAQNSHENLTDLINNEHNSNNNTSQYSMTTSSVSRSNSPTADSTRRPLTSGSGSGFGSSGKKGKQLSAREYVQAWRIATLPKVLDPLNNADYTFMELLQFIGDNHMQSIDVTEQLLLLVAHIANKSQLNKYLLVEAGIQPIVHRVRDGQVENVYFMALSEICLELMEV